MPLHSPNPPILLLLALLACGEQGPPSHRSDADPAAVSASSVPPLPEAAPPGPIDLGPPARPPIRLRDHLATAQLRLPEGAPPSAHGGRFPLDTPWETVAPGLFRTPLPIRLAHQQFREAPPDTRLLQAGHPIAYDGDLREAQIRATEAATPLTPTTTPSWEIDQDHVYLRLPSGDPNGLVLEHPPSAAHDARLYPHTAGLSPTEYLRIQARVDTRTREALLLPGGAALQFPLDLPEDAQLRLGLALAPLADRRVQGHARLRIHANDTLLYERELRGEAPYADQHLPLPEGTVNLRFEVDPLGDPTADLVLLAEPEVVFPKPPAGPRRILLIGLDTLRPDHLGAHGYDRPTSPHLDAWATRAILFEQAYAPAPRTRPSFRTVASGRWPLDALHLPPFWARLQDAGWSVGGIVANVHLLPNLGFADGAGDWDYHDSAIAKDQVDRALTYLRAHETEDTFLFLHLMDPHIFYEAPAPYTDRFTEGLVRGDLPDRFNRWTVRGWEEESPLKETEKAWIEARYDGEIAYMDAQLDRLLRAVDQLPGQTLIVLTSDHGEEFWEHGAFEHNHSLYEELIRSLLWIIPPKGWAGGPHRIHTPVSLADIAPTLLGFANITPQDPEAPGFDLGPLLVPNPGPEAEQLRTRLSARPLPLGHLMFDTERWGVKHGNYKYILHTHSGTEELYDLATDPQEQKNLAPTADPALLEEQRAALALATHWPVGPGWRIDIAANARPFELTFSEPLQAATVIDPEANRTRRANLEWGEVPPLLPENIAIVALSSDARTLWVQPKGAAGTLALLGPGPTTSATLTESLNLKDLLPRSGPPRPIPKYTITPGPARLGGEPGQVRPGTLIFPLTDEKQALQAARDADTLDALRALGYIR